MRQIGSGINLNALLIAILFLISIYSFIMVSSRTATAQSSFDSSAFIGTWVGQNGATRIKDAIITNGQNSQFLVQFTGDGANGTNMASGYPPAAANLDGSTMYGQTICAANNVGTSISLSFAISLAADKNSIFVSVISYLCTFDGYIRLDQWTDVLSKPTSGGSLGCDLSGLSLSSFKPNVVLEQSSNSSTIINVNYNTTDVRSVEVDLYARLVGNPPSYDPSTNKISYLFEKDILYVDPSQSVPIGLGFAAPRFLPVGEYNFNVTAIARYGTCHSNQSALNVKVDVQPFVPSPDFTLSVAPQNLTIARGDSQQVSITLQAQPATKGPLQVDLSATWAHGSSQPLLVGQGFSKPSLVLNPSQNSTVELNLKPYLNDTLAKQPSYAGEFLLTVSGSGVWSDGSKKFQVSHYIDIRIAIVDDPTDFRLESNATSLNLTKEGGAIKLDVLLNKGPPRSVTLQTIGFYPDLILRFDKVAAVPNFSSILSITPVQQFNGTRHVQVIASGAGIQRELSLAITMNISKPVLPPPPTSNPVPSSSNANPISVTIDSEPRLDGLILDNITIPSKDLQYQDSWKVGEIHQLTAKPIIQTDQAKRFVFDSWSDGDKSPVRTIQVSTLSMTIVGKYRPQYYLNIDTQSGDPIGSGWYDGNTVAGFSVLKSTSSGFGVNNVFESWSGKSANLIGQLCSNETNPSNPSNADSGTERIHGIICMNQAHNIIPLWRTDNSLQFGIIGGGIAAASIGGVVTALSKTGQLSKMLKGKRPKIPILTWEIYAPKHIVGSTLAYFDIRLKNVGEADAKNIKVELISEDLTCPPYLIDTLMPWETQRISFAALPKPNRASYESRIVLQSKFVPKKEAMAVLVGTELKYVPRKEKSISISTSDLHVCIYETHGTSRSAQLAERLSSRGFSIDLLNAGDVSMAGIADMHEVIILPSIDEVTKEDVASLKNLLGAGKGLVLIGEQHIASSALSESSRDLLALFGCKIDNPSIENYERPFSIRVSDSNHPVTRGFDAGDAFRAGGRRGRWFHVSPSSGSVVMEQWLSMPQGARSEAVELPAIFANQYGSIGENIRGQSGRTIYLNFDFDSNVLSEILSRSILWVGGIINDEPEE